MIGDVLVGAIMVLIVIVFIGKLVELWQAVEAGIREDERRKNE